MIPTHKIKTKNQNVGKFTARVREIIGEEVILNKSSFYPGGPTHPFDTGIIVNTETGKEHIVDRTRLVGEKIFHRIHNALDLNVNNMVECIVNITRRSYFTKLNTAHYIISQIVFNSYNVNTKNAKISLNGGVVEFNSKLEHHWIDEIETIFLDLVKSDFPIRYVEKYGWNYLSIGDLQINFLDGFHVKRTSQLNDLVILGFTNGRKQLHYDAFNLDKNFKGMYDCNVRKYLKDYFEAWDFLFQPSSLKELIKKTIIKYNEVVEELYDVYQKTFVKEIETQSNNKNVGDYNIGIIRLDNKFPGRLLNKLLRSKTIKYNSDLYIFIIRNRISIYSKSNVLLADKIAQIIITKGLSKKGGGSKKLYHFLLKDICIEDAIKDIFCGVVKILDHENNYKKREKKKD